MTRLLTPFEQLCADRPAFAALQAELRQAARPWAKTAAAEDLVARAFEVAVKRELKGNHWDPARTPARAYFIGIMAGEASILRKSARRKPTSPWLEGEDAVDAGPTAEAQLVGHEDEREDDAAMRAFHEKLLRESQTGLSPRVFEAIRAGVSGHAALAEHLGCDRDAIRRAMDRIRKRAIRQRERQAGGGDTEAAP